ncbi:isoprenylcysteine alpha-carbonyl methylesterase ICME-like isoform X2 [Primulina huaijiensis]|uniref:isoprenylcysteine alpha-carbonyl methylesterase ICME-like isoform X2 n=1 Tax=Primulina huaijiensis TaxID=1492673 RepID=UPI003CC75C8D
MPSCTLRLSNPTSPSPFLSSPLSQTAAVALISKVPMPSFLEDDRRNETMPFIPRTLSHSNAANLRRHVASGASRFVLSTSQGQSFQQGVRRAASDTYVWTTWLRFKMFQYLGVGYKWITGILALGCYAFLLLPGFLQVGYNYFYSGDIHRGIVYGDQPRNRLDLYLPKNRDGLKPVVAFVTGGAWIIGNFPQDTISDMVKDVSRGISFVCNNAADYGGDPDRFFLMGQSAGAHIAACALLEQANKESTEGKNSWSVSQLKSFFGLSGGYKFLNFVDHFHSRGLHRSLFLSIMEGEESLRLYSPEMAVQDPKMRNAVSLLPPMILFHGTGDYSIPFDSSKSFVETLQSLGVQAQLILYEGKTHTDLFLQDPMRGGRDDMFEDLVGIIHAGDSEALAKYATVPPRKRLVPEFMLKLASSVSPFDHRFDSFTKNNEPWQFGIYYCLQHKYYFRM